MPLPAWVIPAILGTTAGATGAGIFGGSKAPSIGQQFGDIQSGYQDVGVLPLKSPAFPKGSSTATGGGGFNFDPGQYFDFSGSQKFINKIKAGTRGKNLPQDVRQSILSNPSKVDADLLGGGFGKLKKKGKIGFDPTFTANASPESAAIYDLFQQSELNRAQQNQQFQSMISPLIANLIGFQGQAQSGARNIMNQGFTENSPYIQEQNRIAKQSFFDDSVADLTKGFKQTAGQVAQDLAASGIVGTDFGSMFRQNVTDPFAEQVSSLASQANVLGRDFNDRSLANQRAAFSTYGQAPGMNAGIQGLQLQDLGINPLAFNPTDQFDPQLMAAMAQFIPQFGLQRDALKAGLFSGVLPGAINAAGAPGMGASFGAIGGATIPAAIQAWALSNFANKKTV